MSKKRVYLSVSVELESLADVADDSKVFGYTGELFEQEIRRVVADFSEGAWVSTVQLDNITVEDI